MARNDSAIADSYFLNKPFNPKMATAVGRGRGAWSGGGPMSASPGTLRFWYDERRLYSYRMPLVQRISPLQVGKRFYLLNGDGAPTKMTAQHQRTLRASLNNMLKNDEWAIIPFSALSTAGVLPEDVQLVAATPDRTDYRWERCRNTRCTGKDWHSSLERVRAVGDGKAHEVQRSVHYLGETLFKAKGNYYVCGLDRNDDPKRRMFYLAQLPKPRSAPSSVDEALDALRPKQLPKNTPRQGEWFFQKVRFSKDPLKMKDSDWHKFLRQLSSDHLELFVERTAPYKLTEEDKKNAEVLAKEQYSGPARAANFLRMLRGRRHYASLDGRSFERRHYAPMIIHVHTATGHRMFVRGTIRDAEHDPLKLPEGWYEAVKNLAVRGWRAGGKERAKVD